MNSLTTNIVCRDVRTGKVLASVYLTACYVGPSRSEA